MALKAVLEALDGVDDAIKPLYVEAEGKFVLAIDGFDDHPEVANLRSAYVKTKDDREKAKAEAATLKSRIADLEKGSPDTAATQAKLTALQEQLAAAEAKASDYATKLTGVTRDRALGDALAAAGIVDATLQKAAQFMLSGVVKMDDDGTAYVEEPGRGPKVLRDYVKSWAAGEGKAFVTPPKGGDARGGDRSGNPTQPKGNLAGNKQERQAALAARFPDLQKG